MSWAERIITICSILVLYSILVIWLGPFWGTIGTLLLSLCWLVIKGGG